MAPYRPGNFEWTPAARETLVKLRAEGFSASVIAGKMSATKGAIIGAMRRFGLSKPGASPIVRDDSLRRASEIAKGTRKPPLPGVLTVTVRSPTPLAAWKPIPYDNVAYNHGRATGVMDKRARQETTRGNISSITAIVARADQRAIDAQTPSRAATFIPTLPRGACCWPLWVDERPTHEYCGTRSLPGRPYCVDHHAMAFR